MLNKKRSLDSVTNDELDAGLSGLITFFHYACFEERGIPTSLGMIYALEHLACQLNLVTLDTPEEADGFVLIEALVMALHARAKENKDPKWPKLIGSLPYARSLT